MNNASRVVRHKTPEMQSNLGGCRPKKAVLDTADHPWRHEDRVRWVEWRVREVTIEGGKYVDERGKYLIEEKAAGGRHLAWGDKVADYAVWLLKDRDGLSWHQIAYRFFPAVIEEQIETYESRVRRAYDRVERSHPGSKQYKPAPLSKEDRVLVQAMMFGARFI
jgi:hypothetical protein